MSKNLQRIFPLQNLTKYLDYADNKMNEFLSYFAPDDEDAFKKRGTAFENQYIRKLDEELKKKLREQVSEKREGNVKGHIKKLKEQLLKERKRESDKDEEDN